MSNEIVRAIPALPEETRQQAQSDEMLIDLWVHGRSPAGGIQSPNNLNPGRTLSRTLALNSWG